MESLTPKDARAATMTPTGDGYRMTQVYNTTVEIWMDVTSQEEIESQIKARNKRTCNKRQEKKALERVH